MTLNVHFATENKTVSYTKFAIETMRRLAKKPEEIIVTIHILEHSPNEILNELTKISAIMVRGAAANLRGSFGHGLALEQMLSLTDDGDTHVIMDSDTVLLMKNWDDYIKTTLSNVDCVGTRYEDMGGFSSGSGTLQTYKSVPNFIWIALSPKHNWSNLKAAHQKHVPINVTSDEMSNVYGLPVGYKVMCDVGWQLPEYLHNNGLTYEGLRQIKPSSEECVVLSGLSDYHEEYHVDGKPFLVHQRGSSKHAFRQGISKEFYDAVDRYLRQI